MYKMTLALVFSSLVATAASAQYYPSSPSPRDRGTERLLCYVDPGLERYRSRPTCELQSWQPRGTDCACPSFDSRGDRVLRGQVGSRR